MSPLSGVRVVELARILAGPWIGQTLADLGADVIKVESPEGDDTRRWGPPFIETNEERRPPTSMRATAANAASSPTSRRQRTRDRAEAAARADVLIENFKVGGLKKYGLDFESLQALNPRLIYCSVTGFGQTGPYAERAGYDYLTQGMSGFMDITGETDGPPTRAGVAISDLFTGLYGVVAIEAALIAREKTGRGQFIDLALLDTTAAILANQAMNYLASGVTPGARARLIRTLRPIRPFRSRTAGSSSRSAMTASSPASAACSASTRSQATRALPRTRPETRTARSWRANSPPRRAVGAGRPARRAGKGRRPGRTDQLDRRPFRRSAIHRAGHAHRPAGNAGPAQPDRHERERAGARAPIPDARRAPGRGPARNRTRLTGTAAALTGFAGRRQIRRESMRSA